VEPPFIFLSYAKPDKDRVLPIYDFLVEKGIRAWFDDKELLAGQRWEFEIRRALDSATLILLCMSRNSVERIGYAQRELRMVMDKIQDRPIGRIYAIPVLLDPGMEIPHEVKDYHCHRITGPADHDSLLPAIRSGFQEFDDVAASVRTEAEIEWSFASASESWEGLPGYNAEVSWPVYRSTRFPLIGQAGDIIKGEVLASLVSERAVKLDQDPDMFSFGQEEWNRTNQFSLAWETPVVKNRVLSHRARVDYYWAGAAHGNHGHDCWVFVMDPLVRVKDLSSVFQDPDQALICIQREVRPRLLADLEETDPSEGEDFLAMRVSQIDDGTNDWEAFRSFGFEHEGLMLMFPPYQIAAYSHGPRSVVIPYAVVAPLLRRPYADALGVSGSSDE
jgi:hypothetical protein